MVLASRGEFYRAGWYIFFAGVLDALDGRVARLSRTGTRFGAELDSLVDVVSFGVAPAFLIYQLEFATGGQAEWIFCYFYRSEEHTSELQSLTNLVCRLLLEKKKNTLDSGLHH